MLVNDTIDFIMLKEGKQLNGVISSVKGFAQKCGNTITNSGILAILAIFGFSTELGLEQPAGWSLCRCAPGGRTFSTKSRYL